MSSRSKWPEDRRRMPPAHVVRSHWAPRLTRGRYRKFGSVAEFTSAFYCFACGYGWDLLDRAHIVPRQDGGSDDAANLHLLCKICHVESETMTGRRYWRWFFRQSFSRVMRLIEGKEEMLE